MYYIDHFQTLGLVLAQAVSRSDVSLYEIYGELSGHDTVLSASTSVFSSQDHWPG